MNIFPKAYYFLLSGFLLIMPVSTMANEQIQNPVVLELFTSQSCSSCPSADKVLQEFSHLSHVIALGYHVTYWNHLDWKDTLSLQSATELQNEFNAGLGANRVYTPQMVVNGVDEFTGSKRGRVANHVEEMSPVARLDVNFKNDKIFTTIPENVRNDKNLTLMVVGFDKDITQSISDGENSGEVVAYTNPVTSIDYIQEWKRENKSVEIPIISKTSGGYAVIIREGRAGKIIAAGQVRL